MDSARVVAEVLVAIVTVRVNDREVVAMPLLAEDTIAVSKLADAFAVAATVPRGVVTDVVEVCVVIFEAILVDGLTSTFSKLVTLKSRIFPVAPPSKAACNLCLIEASVSAKM